MSSRHSSHGGSPRGSHTPSSASYRHQQSDQQQQYLRPEDVYRMDREGSYFGSSSVSYTQSRHGSATNSPRHSEIPPHQQLPSQSFSPSPFDSYAYQPGEEDAFLSPERRVTPPEDMRGVSRHGTSHSDPRHEVSKDFSSNTGQRSKSDSPKGKGKEREGDNGGGERRRSSGNGRHDPERNGSGRKESGPANRLVHGVFIRY